MSNPFRTAHPDTSAPSTTSSQPLSINTGSRPEKHVRIASPPDTAYLSPASYPPSPVFTRLSPSTRPPISTPEFASSTEASPGNPFNADESGEEEEEVITEALKNARLNSNAANADSVPKTANPGSAVQNTLSRFASRPRGSRQPSDRDEKAPILQKAAPVRQTMDVDAFTRLLLTGGGTAQAGQPATAPVPGNNISDSSSNADSASVSRQSIFEPLPAISADSPRTSQDLDGEDAYRERKEATRGEIAENGKKAPPTPKPRHGKLIRQDSQKLATEPSKGQSMPPEILSPGSDLNKPLPLPPDETSIQRKTSATSIVGTDSAMQIKRPPTPPLSRRRSQISGSKPPLSRSSPSPQSLTTTSQSPASFSSLSLAPKTPPPPPSRRISQRGPSTDLPSTLEELATDPMEQADLSRPILPKEPLNRTPSSTRRPSFASSDAAPPPLPPPRRNRGQSSASLTKDKGEDGARDIRRPSADSGRSIPQPSRDILADLASLQKEVDALRAQRRNL